MARAGGGHLVAQHRPADDVGGPVGDAQALLHQPHRRSQSKGLQLNTSRWKRLCSGKVCTLMWLSAMITIPVIPQSSGTTPR